MTSLVQILKDLPIIIKFILQIKAFIDTEIDISKRAALLKKVGDAVQDTHTKGDTSAIEALFTKPSTK